MMNFMMMTMATPTDTSRAKKLVKLLERLVRQDHFYDSEKLKEMKAQLRVLKEEIARAEAKSKKGFGKK